MTQGELIKQYRLVEHPNAPVKAKDFADEVGITRHYLSSLEHDRLTAGINTIYKLRKVGVKI